MKFKAGYEPNEEDISNEFKAPKGNSGENSPMKSNLKVKIIYNLSFYDNNFETKINDFLKSDNILIKEIFHGNTNKYPVIYIYYYDYN